MILRLAMGGAWGDSSTLYAHAGRDLPSHAHWGALAHYFRRARTAPPPTPRATRALRPLAVVRSSYSSYGGGALSRVQSSGSFSALRYVAWARPQKLCRFLWAMASCSVFFGVRLAFRGFCKPAGLVPGRAKMSRRCVGALRRFSTQRIGRVYLALVSFVPLCPSSCSVREVGAPISPTRVLRPRPVSSPSRPLLRRFRSGASPGGGKPPRARRVPPFTPFPLPRRGPFPGANFILLL